MQQDAHTSRQERVCVYSVLVGGYETLLEQPIAAESGLDFILLTDDESISSDTWTVRDHQLILPQDPARSSRLAKLLPHRFFPDHDISIYIDNALLLRQTPEQILDRMLSDETTFALNAHSFRETIADEFDAVVGAGKEASWVAAEQLEHYRQWRPEALDMKPLWTGFMIRRHHDPELIRAMELWWTYLLRYSRRDQLSLVVALLETGFEPTVLDNDLLSSEFYQWPMEVGRIQERGGKLPEVPELEECRLDLEAMARTAAGLEAERDALVSRVEDMEQSNSWRVTAPLRRLGSMFKGGS